MTLSTSFRPRFITAAPTCGRMITIGDVLEIVLARWNVTRSRAWVLRIVPGRHKFGSQVRFDEDVVTEWVDQHLREGAA